MTRSRHQGISIFQQYFSGTRGLCLCEYRQIRHIMSRGACNRVHGIFCEDKRTNGEDNHYGEQASHVGSCGTAGIILGIQGAQTTFWQYMSKNWFGFEVGGGNTGKLGICVQDDHQYVFSDHVQYMIYTSIIGDVSICPSVLSLYAFWLVNF